MRWNVRVRKFVRVHERVTVGNSGNREIVCV